MPFLARWAKDHRFRSLRERKKWKVVTVSREQLREDVKEWIEHRIVEETTETYDVGWTAWTEFCHQYDHDPHDVSEQDIRDFCGWLARRRDVIAKTMRIYCYGVKSELMSRNIYVDLRVSAMPFWHAALEGRARDDIESGRAPPPHHSITREVLDEWLDQYWALPDTEVSRRDKLVWTAFALISQQTLRRSNEMVQSKIGGMKRGMFSFESAHESGYPLLGRNESWSILSFSGSKTTRKASRKGEKQAAVLACHCKYGKYCALHSLIDLIRFGGGGGPGANLFVLSDGRVITYKMELEWVKERAIACGMDPALFATHGFRSGGVIDAYDERGENPKTRSYCKTQANWRGEMDQVYNGKRTPMLQARRSLKMAGIDTKKFKWAAKKGDIRRGPVTMKPARARKMGFFGRNAKKNAKAKRKRIRL